MKDTNENINEIDRELSRTRVKKYTENIGDNYYENSATKKNQNKKYKLKPSLVTDNEKFIRIIDYFSFSILKRAIQKMNM